MKSHRLALVGATVAWLVALSAVEADPDGAPPPTQRTWQLRSGRTFKARLTAVRNATAHFDGTNFTGQIPLRHLSPYDQRVAKRLSPELSHTDTAQSETSDTFSLDALLGPQLHKADRRLFPTRQLAGKLLGLYFSAHWCMPCREFTPTLLEFRNAALEQGHAFEVVFVSADRNQDKMLETMRKAELPWPAIPYDAPQRTNVVTRLGVRGYPTLVIVGPTGEVITANGRRDILNLGLDAFEKWIAAAPSQARHAGQE